MVSWGSPRFFRSVTVMPSGESPALIRSTMRWIVRAARANGFLRTARKHAWRVWRARPWSRASWRLLRLAWLQVVQGGRYRYLSENNRIRLERLSGPRGMIFDRRGDILADVRASFDASMPVSTVPVFVTTVY